MRRNAGFDAAREALLTDKGKQTMDSIRHLIAEMRNEEDKLLQRRSDAASVSLQNTRLTLTIGTGLSLSLLLLSFYIVNREVGERRRAENALQQLNDELDKRIEQRTAELAAAKEQIEQQLHRLKSLRVIDLAILGATDLRLALKTVAEEATARLQADITAVFIFNPDTLMLNLATLIGSRVRETQRLTVRLGDGISGKAALERRIIAVPNLTESGLSAPCKRSHPQREYKPCMQLHSSPKGIWLEHSV